MIPFLNPIHLLMLDLNEEGELDPREIEEAMMDLRIRIEGQGGTWGHQGQRLDADVVMKAAARLLDSVQRPFFCALQGKPELLAFLEAPTLERLRGQMAVSEEDIALYTFFQEDLLRAWNRLQATTLHHYDWKGCLDLLICPDWLDWADHYVALEPMRQAIHTGYQHWGRLAAAKAKGIHALLQTEYLRQDLTQLVDVFPAENTQFRIRWAEQLLKAADQLHRHEFHAEAFKALAQVRQMDLEGAVHQHAETISQRIHSGTPPLARPDAHKLNPLQELLHSWRDWIWIVIPGLLWLIFGFETC